MARVRANFVFGSVENNPLAAGGVTLNSSTLDELPVVQAGDIAIIVLDPRKRYGDPEIVYVTYHGASATTATISRGKDGTTAREHQLGTEWIHAPVIEDWDHGGFSGLGDDDHPLYIKTDGTRGIVGDQSIYNTSAASRVLNVKASGDSQVRFSINADGKMQWGSGSVVQDTNLYRSSNDTLKTDDNIVVGGGTLQFGADCSLYRSGADALQTDDALRVNNTFRADAKTSIYLSSSTSAGIGVRVNTDSQDRFGVDASGKITWGSGTSSSDVNLYRSAIDTLKTDDTFVASNLTIGSTVYAYTPTGAVSWFAGSSAPSGWLLCDGTAVSRTTYSVLFALIGTTYGNGDGVNTFNLPNISQKIISGKSGGTSLGQTSTQTITASGATASGSISQYSDFTDIPHWHWYYSGVSGQKQTSDGTNYHRHWINGPHTHSAGTIATTLPDFVLNAIIKY